MEWFTFYLKMTDNGHSWFPHSPFHPIRTEPSSCSLAIRRRRPRPGVVGPGPVVVVTGSSCHRHLPQLLLEPGHEPQGPVVTSGDPEVQQEPHGKVLQKATFPPGRVLEAWPVLQGACKAVPSGDSHAKNAHRGVSRMTPQSFGFHKEDAHEGLISTNPELQGTPTS